MATSKKFIPGSDATAEEIFTLPFLIDDESSEFIEKHKRIMFIIRGPPGTAKGSLTDLILRNFPTGVKCSADDYFSNTFNSRVRTKESLKEAHFYCHRKVKKECIKNSHPVIVTNTHMKKSEFQEYLNLAAEYEYTIIISSTLDKFEISPKILEKSNTKGLTKEYFLKRIKAWEDVYPITMGWFLCPEDSSYILNQLQSALDSLLSDGKFCRIFNAFDTDTVLDSYKAKTLLCCVAGFSERSLYDFQNYYKSPEVRDSYGKCFTVSIQAFVVTKPNIFAVVELNDLKNLLFKPNFKNVCGSSQNDVDNIVNSLQSLSLSRSYDFKLVPLKNKFTQDPPTAMFGDNLVGCLNIDNSSFIHIAQSKENMLSLCELDQLFRKNFIGAINEDGELSVKEFNKLECGFTIYRLKNDAWMIQLPQVLSVKTVFTGLYI